MGRINKYFESAIEARCRIMTRDFGLRVVIQGSRCCTDGKTIYLPMLEDAPDEVMADLDGMADHEVSHCIFTDFEAWNKRLKLRFHYEFTNAIEDSRIELLMRQKFTGTTVSLDRLNAKWQFRSNEKRFKKNDAGEYVTPWPVRLIVGMREIYDGRPVHMDSQTEIFLIPLRQDILNLRKLDNTGDLIVGTAEIIKKINKIREDLFIDGDDFDVPDAEILEAIRQLGVTSTPPIELDPNRKDKEATEGTWEDSIDPATELKEGKDGQSSDETSEDGTDNDSDADQTDAGDAENETDESQTGESGSESGEAEESGDGEGQSGEKASISAEQRGDEQGKGDSSSDDTATDSGEEQGSVGGGGGTTDEDTDGERPDTSDLDEDAGEGVGDGDAGSDAESEDETEGHGSDNYHGDEVSEGQQQARAEVRNKIDAGAHKRETEESATTQKYSDVNAIRDRLKREAKEFAGDETDLEKQMLEDSIGDKSEFDEHVFSSESYGEIVLQPAVVKAQTDSADYKGWYDGEQVDDRMVTLPFSREYDEVIDYTGRGDTEQHAKRLRVVNPFVIPVTMHLDRLLRVKENVRTKFDRDRGLINVRSLSRFTTDPNFRTPFKETTKDETRNVAVTLLNDCSGSMGSGDKMEVARQSALALGESLKRLGIVFEVLGFNTSGSSKLSNAVRDSGISHKDLERFTRTGTILRHMVFKKFESNDLSGICRAESGGANEDSESVAWAAQRLAQRPEARKILIVLSDGQPAGEAPHEVSCGDLKRVVKALPRIGIEVIGIGIQTDAPKDFYPDWVKVPNVKDLPSVVLGKFSDILLKGAR